MRRRILLVLLLFGCQVGAYAFRLPDKREAPVGSFDIRSQPRESDTLAASNVRTQVRAALRSLGNATAPAVQVRFHPSTGWPRHLFSLDGRLSGPSTKSPEAIARDFLSTHKAVFGFSETEIAETVVSDDYRHPDGKMRHLILQQRCSNLDVFQARLQFAFDDRGRVIHFAGSYYPGLRFAGSPRLSALEAVQWAAAHCDRAVQRGQTVAPKTALRLAELSAAHGGDQQTVFAAGPFRDPVAPRLVLMPMGSVGLPAWEMTLHINSLECYHVLVDARNGSLLYRTNLYKYVQPIGFVFTKHPDAGPQQLVSFMGDPVASPLGWCNPTTTTRGNNIVVREDADGNNEVVPGIQPSDSDGLFIYPFMNSWADQHTTGPDVNAVVTNLFYACNWYHDYLYALGFDEASGNFQQDNFGRGGQGSDRVYADAMDGSGFNNSSFLCLPDGDPPGPYGGHSRLQMFLFKPLSALYPLYRDGDLDGDVVLHEYTHGMTARMVGGPSNVLALDTLQAASMAEGWSDFFPCSVFDDPVMAEYVTGNTTHGARHGAYDAHPWRFGFVGRTFEITTPTLPAGGPFGSIFLPEVHTDGEIWAAALWTLRTELGNKQLAEQLVVEALRYTPPEPTMLDGRDAILLADAVKFGGVHQAQIWRAFARRGMGWSAEAEEGPRAALVFQTFDWPPALGGLFSTGTIVFADDMESSPSGWSVTHSSSGSQVAFHPTSHRSASGSWSWYFGQEDVWNYNTGSREWSTLESPPITLPPGSGYCVEFKHWREAEDAIQWSDAPFYHDPGIIYIHVAGTDEYFEVGFSFHNTAGWETRRIDISFLAGRTIHVGFYFDTWDQRNNTYEGWYIDDVQVLKTFTTNTPPTAARPVWNAYR